MAKFARPCLDCGRLTRNGSRCEAHQKVKDKEWDLTRAARKRATGQYAGDYRKRAEIVRKYAEYCWLCGQGPRENDPFQADHVFPGDPSSPLAAAHRSCNASRGNKPAF